jgi:hypothetical protein
MLRLLALLATLISMCFIDILLGSIGGNVFVFAVYSPYCLAAIYQDFYGVRVSIYVKPTHIVSGRRGKQPRNTWSSICD